MPRNTPHPESVVALESAYDFDTTILRLKAALEFAGATVFADIDQRDAAQQAGLELRRTRLILFGNPKAGTPVMASNPHAALELPLRVVIWENENGRAHLDYLDVTHVLGSHYGIAPAQYAVLQKVPAMLETVVA